MYLVVRHDDACDLWSVFKVRTLADKNAEHVGSGWYARQDDAVALMRWWSTELKLPILHVGDA